NAHIDYFWALVTGAQEAIRKHREFYDEYNALLDLHGKFYTETIDVIFQRHLLPKGELVLDGRRVDLSKIDVPLLVVEGGKDDICGVGQTSAAHELCTSLPAAKRDYYLEPEAGHYGVFNGKLWRANIAPRIAAFQTKWDRPSLLAA
ncbi:MAG TPA: polyhydroxyalkanoate depolymerase, partial [Myxococcota bacterium]|nr:polyhydroxyalkanoate depolymerase [Myxococcota bacterium]